MITACTALSALVLLAVAVVTGRLWWVAIAMTAITALNAVLYFRERRRFRSTPRGPASVSCPLSYGTTSAP